MLVELIRLLLVINFFHIDGEYTDNNTKCTNKCDLYGDESYYSCWTVSEKWGNCTPVFSGKPFNFKNSVIWIFTLSPNVIYLIDPCEEWPTNYFKKFDEPNETLVDELYTYGRHNLALIHVMIQSPYVTKIKRDVAIPFVTFISNTGGLLGLCIGFSFISG